MNLLNCDDSDLKYELDFHGKSTCSLAASLSMTCFTLNEKKIPNEDKFKFVP